VTKGAHNHGRLVRFAHLLGKARKAGIQILATCCTSMGNAWAGGRAPNRCYPFAHSYSSILYQSHGYAHKQAD
jgi:hypothetical protein